MGQKWVYKQLGDRIAKLFNSPNNGTVAKSGDRQIFPMPIKIYRLKFSTTVILFVEENNNQEKRRT